MKKKAFYIKPVVDIVTTWLLCGSPFETLDGETTGDGFCESYRDLYILLLFSIAYNHIRAIFAEQIG